MKLILQDSNIVTRSEFYGKYLASLGVPLIQALTPQNPVKVSFEGQPFSLGSPKVEEEFDPFEDGFSGPRCWTEGCLGWIWCQWLSQASPETIRKEVEFVVDRGMEMQERCSIQRYRCLHDLWLLNCAILAASPEKLAALAGRVVDSKGDTSRQSKDTSPPNNNGELFAAAWCGMLKYWILGDLQKSIQESELIWGAYRYDIARFAPKSLVAKWLAGDLRAFVKLQQKDFNGLWEWARKNQIVVSESDSETVIAFHRMPVPGRGWSWAHCGLAMLAHRHGVEVATDPFWFPPHALQCVAPSRERTIESPTKRSTEPPPRASVSSRRGASEAGATASARSRRRSVS
jgi:hypothetical protein